MKRLPLASWKIWNRIPASPKRSVRLGIDYGSIASKIVFRDRDAPVEGSAVLVLRNGSYRIPSRVCMTATELFFGDDSKAPTDCDIYENLKMRVAAEVDGNPSHQLGPARPLAHGFSASDLAALTVWFLISEGHRAVASRFNGHMEGVEFRMTMGVPMAYFHDKQRKTSFLNVARRAWSFYCQEGLLDPVLPIENAHRVLEEHPAALPAIPEHEIQDWIRCEGEAALWWLLRSPGVGTGPYAMVDIGAGTTHANLFRLFGKVQTPKRTLVPYGAASVPVGMGAVHRALAGSGRLSGDSSVLRGLDPSTLQANPGIREALRPVCDQIYDSCRKAWIEAYSKMSDKALELSAWETYAESVAGGGSLLPILVDAVRSHPDRPEPLTVRPLEQPIDLVRADRREVASEELPFATVAYGLSSSEPFLPHPHRRDPG